MGLGFPRGIGTPSAGIEMDGRGGQPVPHQATTVETVEEFVIRGAVVGVGSIGGTPAARLAAGGHEVTITSSRRAEALASHADRIGARAGVPADAVADADVVIVSVPTEAMPTVASDIHDKLPADAVLVDTSNYVPVSATGRSLGSRTARSKAFGFPSSSGTLSSRRSTTSTTGLCRSATARPARLTGSHFLRLVTTRSAKAS